MAGYRRRWNNRRYRSRRSFNKWAYNKTSAKNQAKQLVRLNKKVNRINRICRPVIYRYETDGYIDTTFTDADGFRSGQTTIDLHANINQDEIAKCCYFNIAFGVSFASSTTPALVYNRDYRVIIVQNKQGSENPSFNNLLENRGFSIMLWPHRANNYKAYKYLADTRLRVGDKLNTYTKTLNFKKLNQVYFNADDSIGDISIIVLSDKQTYDTEENQVRVYYRIKYGLRVKKDA